MACENFYDFTNWILNNGCNNTKNRVLYRFPKCQENITIPDKNPLDGCKGTPTAEARIMATAWHQRDLIDKRFKENSNPGFVCIPWDERINDSAVNNILACHFQKYGYDVTKEIHHEFYKREDILPQVKFCIRPKA